jgi:proteic killer suppression protein
MIEGFADKTTERFWNGVEIAAFRSFSDQARKRLLILDAATALSDLRALQSNRLEALKGKRNGQWSIRINLQWRVCFVWGPGEAGPDRVEIVDYHDE